MKPIDEMSIGELAAHIAEHLQQHGIKVVLKGGSCVSIGYVCGQQALILPC